MKKIIEYIIFTIILTIATVLIAVSVSSFNQSNGFYNFEANNSKNEWWMNVSSVGWCPQDNCTNINNSWFSWNKSIDIVCPDNSSVSQDLSGLSWNVYDNQSSYQNASVLWNVCTTTLNLTLQNGFADNNIIRMDSWITIKNIGLGDINDINTKAVLNSHWFNSTLINDYIMWEYSNGSTRDEPLEGDKNTTNDVLKPELADHFGYYELTFYDNTSADNQVFNKRGSILLYSNYTRNGTNLGVTANSKLQIKVIKSRPTDVIFKTSFGSLNASESIIYQHASGGDPNGVSWSFFAYHNATNALNSSANESPGSNNTITIDNNSVIRIEHKWLLTGTIAPDVGMLQILNYTFNETISKADNITDIHDFNTSTVVDTNTTDGGAFNGSVITPEKLGNGTIFAGISTGDTSNVTWVINTTGLVPRNYTVNMTYSVATSGPPTVTPHSLLYNVSIYAAGVATGGDTTPPNVIQPTETLDPINPNQTIELNISCTDASSCAYVSVQITQPNGSLVNRSMSNTSTNSTIFFNLTTYTHLIGNYTLKFYANDSIPNVNSTTVSDYIVNDSFYVNVTSLTNTPNPVNPNNTIELNTTVTDNVGVGTVIIMLTQPNSSLVNLSTTLNNARYFNRTTFTHLNGTYNWTVYANDTSGLVNKTESSSYQVKDTQIINISNAVETPDPVTPNNTIESNVTVLDNVAVDTVLGQLTYPNASLRNYTYSLGTGNIYTNRSLNTQLIGTYTINFWANDTNNNINRTTSSTYATTDSSNPNVTALQAVPDPVYEGNFISINATVLDNVAVDTVIFEQLNGTLTNYTSVLSASKYHNFTVNSTTIGNNTIRVYANDTNGNRNNTEKIGYVVKQNFAPNVTRLNETSKQNQPNQTIKINATIDDEESISLAVIMMTYPNASLRNYTMSNLSVANNFTNLSLNGTLLGRYNYTIYANDSRGKANLTESSFFTVNDTTAPTVTLIVPTNNSAVDQPINFTFNTTDDVELKNATLYHNGSGNFQAITTISINGTFNITNFTDQGIPVQTYLWNVYVCDMNNNCGFASTNFTFIVPKKGAGTTGISAGEISKICPHNYELLNGRCTLSSKITKIQQPILPKSKDIIDNLGLKSVEGLNRLDERLKPSLPTQRNVPKLGLLFAGAVISVTIFMRGLLLFGLVGILMMLTAYYDLLRPYIINFGLRLSQNMPVTTTIVLISALSLWIYVFIKGGLKKNAIITGTATALSLTVINNRYPFLDKVVFLLQDFFARYGSYFSPEYPAIAGIFITMVTFGMLSLVYTRFKKTKKPRL